MRHTPAFLICFLICFSLAKAQDSKPFFQSLEVEYEKATFDQARGLGLKLNHVWKTQKRSIFQSGLMLSALTRPGASPPTTGVLREFNSSLRLQLHAGYEWRFGANRKWLSFAEGFAGLRSYLITGSLDQPNQGFDRNFSDFTVRGDLGYRLGLGYQVAPQWSLQASITGSILEVNHPLGWYTGLLVWGPDYLALLGVGLRYHFDWKK